jgi:hypothetical protein
MSAAHSAAMARATARPKPTAPPVMKTTLPGNALVSSWESADLDDDLAEGAAVGDMTQRRRGFRQRERGADVRLDAARREQLEEFPAVPARQVGPVLTERAKLQALDGDALEQPD